MGAFEELEKQGIRIISGDVSASCWAYGVLGSGEVFYFSCDRSSANLWVLIYDFDRHPTDRPDWHVENDETIEGSDTDSLWPEDEHIIAHFGVLLGWFLRSNKAGRAKPMSEEMFARLRESELRDMMS